MCMCVPWLVRSAAVAAPVVQVLAGLHDFNVPTHVGILCSQRQSNEHTYIAARHSAGGKQSVDIRVESTLLCTDVPLMYLGRRNAKERDVQDVTKATGARRRPAYLLSIL